MVIKTDQVKVKNNLSVIMYHYVRDLKNSSYPAIKGLDVKLFLNQLKFINENYTVIRMEHVLACLDENKKLPENAALLTFDDGYSDHFDFVFPLLKNFGLQGSFYIPAQAVKEHVVLDVNKIHFILASTDTSSILQDLKLLIKNENKYGNLGKFEDYFVKLAIPNRFDTSEVIFIKRLLQVELDELVRSKFVDFLFKKYVNEDEVTFAQKLYINEAQLIEMHKAGMHIGCHGYNHYWWNRLDDVKLEKEIDLSLSFLTSLGIDLNNWTAAYPYGSYSESVENILAIKGCKIAFTTEVGIATIENSTRFKAKRFDTNDIAKSKI